MSAAITVDAAYRRCEEITRREARNFSYGIRLLPRDKRRALSAVYATARRIDDIGDGGLPPDEKLARLDEVRESLRRLPGTAPDDPVLLALHDAAGRLPIPLEAFEELIDGCAADVRGTTYATFDDLLWYCRCVAGSVGRLSLGVFGTGAPGLAAERADALGIALQMTNILRDLREDRGNGRVYLPKDDLDRFGCNLEFDGDGFADPSDRFAALVRFEAERAEGWYETGLRLLPMLDARSAACTAAMAGIYHRLLARIVRDPMAVTRTRISLPSSEKATVAARALVRRTA
ncbi:presqualene diphosphate synthase HpnD [Dactylosporangium sp. NPDC000555]|uniref:presqualene diphosphate synthase HpnD n=1 Tax=Dactylosporangium sp. NPDC000555 TaxID=3154260 RepID=UPI00332D7F55